MKCLHCRAEMKRGTAPFHIDRHGVHVRLDDIPAWVCTQCGEALFEEDEVDAIQQLAESVEEQRKKLAEK